ncbi:large ribosomal subunit protein eL6 [Euwallacea fornicatus]|uniref:large ribosomal subunit protein eL6 n=1 Tax=Euwallacea fornicatus TaxID=995702 RepID=UPI00339057B2
MAPTEKKKKSTKPRNYDLGNGVVRFSRSAVYHKKALYKFIGKKVDKKKKTSNTLGGKPKGVAKSNRFCSDPGRVVEKQIGGEKNGGKRYVLIKKRRAVYPTQDKIKKRPSKQLFKDHKRTLKPSITPGTILILLAGAHKGKRVVFLKQLRSGLLLVTGPYEINGCPLRRISQRYVIGTQTKVNIKEVKLPKNLTDTYFKRQRQKRAKKEEGDIFQKKKEGYKVSDTRKADQKIVDAQVFAAIRKHSDRKVLLAYLSAMFGLRSSQFPHRLQF